MDQESSGDSEVQLGALAQESSLDENAIMENPALKRLFNQLLDECIKKASVQGEGSGSTLLSILSPTPNNPNANTGKGHSGQVNNVKSPSDTTVYVPALGCKDAVICNEFVINRGNKDANESIINIENFVESMRIKHDKQNKNVGSIWEDAPGQQLACAKADQAIIEAEKF